jgi:alpha-N-arabinofuranosidase
MANIAQTVNVLQAMVLTRDEQMLLTPTYHVFEMFKVHQGATLLPIDLTCGEYHLDGVTVSSRLSARACEGIVPDLPREIHIPAEAVPAISASASRNADGIIHLSLANVDPDRDIVLCCQIRGMPVTQVSGRILTADAIDAHNTFEETDKVQPLGFEGARPAEGGLEIALPARSVVVLAMR